MCTQKRVNAASHTTRLHELMKSIEQSEGVQAQRGRGVRDSYVLVEIGKLLQLLREIVSVDSHGYTSQQVLDAVCVFERLLRRVVDNNAAEV